MSNILLSFLMLFSLSVFASTGFEAGYTSSDYVEIKAATTTANKTARPCESKTEPFDRMYIVTGAATQYKETTYAPSGLSLKSVGLPNEVGWRSTQTI